MSYTFPAKTSATRTAGRGRGRGRGRGGSLTAERNGGEVLGQESQQGSEDAQSNNMQGRMERRDAYTVIAPNEKKRQAIAKQAEKETSDFEKYKAGKKLGHVSYVGTVGGGEATPSCLKTTPQKFPNKAAFDRRAKSQQWRDEQKKKEETENEKKKQDARKKALQNEHKDTERQAKLREDHRVKNDAFLARFEKKRPPPHAREPKTEELGEPSGGATGEDQQNQSNVEKLHADFPYYDHSFLQDILAQANEDVNQAKQLLIFYQEN